MNLAERVNLNLQLLNGQNELNLFVLKESLTYLKLLKSPKFSGLKLIKNVQLWYRTRHDSLKHYY